MTDTPTPADVAGMTMTNDAAAETLERMMRYLVGAEERLAYRTAIAALRTAPPAPGNGAAEMREAAVQVADRMAGKKALCIRCAEGVIAAIRALPAPEVPEAGRVPDIARLWCEQFDGRSSNTLYDRLLRDMLREWYNV